VDLGSCELVEKSKMTRVSVVVPLYNKRPYLLRALLSLADQTFQDFEAIVVNDGSTDDGEELVAQFGDSRIRLVNQTNAGPGAARNRGIAESSGALAAFLDADDEWLPKYLQTAVEAFDKNPQLACCTQGYLEAPSFRSTEPLWRKFGLTEGVQSVSTSTVLQLHYMVAYMNSQATVARPDVLRKWGGFFENRCMFGEDSFLWLKILLNEEAAFILRPGVCIHRESGELSQNRKGARGLEPFLMKPQEIEQACPLSLLPLLRSFLALRAFKTACVWGYYGEWKRAAEIRRRFRVPGDWRLPYYVSSLMCSTPLGARIGATWRAFAAYLPRARRSNISDELA